MFPEHICNSFKISDITSIKNSLSTNGYAVVNIDSIDIDHVKKLFAIDMAEITGNDINFPELWNKKSAIPNSTFPGLMGEYGLSQGKSAWYIRCNRDIINLYKKLLNADDVVCSMDAIGFSQDNNGYLNGTSLHTDQNPYGVQKDINSIQGIFYAEDTYGDRAGTAVVPGSHIDYMKHSYTTDNYTPVNQAIYSSNAVKLTIKAGCLLLFTSKLVHQGVYGSHRLCFMVCYGDKKDRSEQVKKKKITMYLGGHRSNHWSQYAVNLGWKWEHGESWNMLNSTTISPGYSDQIDMLEDEITDPESYTDNMDMFIPLDRLSLI